MTLGAVVVHYGDPAPTLACVRSIRRDPSSVTRRLVVVDAQGNLEPGGLGDADLVPAIDNPGFGVCANRGVARLRATGEDRAYLILNNDVELLPGCLDAAATAVADRPRIGAAGGPIHLDRPSGPLWSAGGEVCWLTGTVRQRRSPAAARRERVVGFLPGAVLAVAPAAWRAVGGFDPGFFLYHEDLDLCLRLRRAGYELRFVPALRAVHHLGATTGSGRRSPLYLEHLTRTRLRPFHSPAYRAYLALIHTGYVLARAAVLGLRHGVGAGPRIRALFRGHRAALGDVWRIGAGGGRPPTGV